MIVVLAATSLVVSCKLNCFMNSWTSCSLATSDVTAAKTGALPYKTPEHNTSVSVRKPRTQHGNVHGN